MNNGYVAAGYVLIWASLGWFAWRTHLRVRAAERALEGLETDRGRAIASDEDEERP